MYSCQRKKLCKNVRNMLALWKIFQTFYGKNFTPKIYEVLKYAYNTKKFWRDYMTVTSFLFLLWLLPMMLSGTRDKYGNNRRIFDGSRYQIGDPTGAFAIVVFNVIQNYGSTDCWHCLNCQRLPKTQYLYQIWL